MADINANPVRTYIEIESLDPYVYVSDPSVVNDRLINIKDYMPGAYDGSESYEFMQFFENILNGFSNTTSAKFYEHTTDLDLDSVDVSILKKIELLYSLRDPNITNKDFLQPFAKNMGYEISYNREDISTITHTTNPVDINGYIRQTIRDLPFVYSRKSTVGAIQTLMYSFGIISDVYVLWTNDYKNMWVPEIPSFEENDESPSFIAEGYYPTPHFIITIDADRTKPGWEDNIYRIVGLIDSVKPINTVFEGFSVKSNFSSTVFVPAAASDIEMIYTLTKTWPPA